MAIEAEDYISVADLEGAVEEAKDGMEDLREEIAELEADIGAHEAEDDLDDAAISDLEDELDAKKTELEELESDSEEMIRFFDEIVGYTERGEVLISEDVFEDYAREMAYDIGAVDRNANWPCNRIDWEAAADDLKIDYTEGYYEGTTYYVRMC